jgi:hypothetical protein
MDTEIERRCRTCGERFIIGLDEQRFLTDRARELGGAWVLPKRCLRCRQGRRRAQQAVTDDGVDDVRQCVVCGQAFHFTAAEKHGYVALGLLTPRRCERCRMRR